MLHILVQILRRCMQLTTIGLIVALPCISLYAHYYAAKATADIVYLEGFLKPVMQGVDRFVTPLHNPEAFLESFKGTLWSMRIAGFDISAPLAACEMVAAAKTLHVPFIISIIVPVTVTLVLGRVFCSWICPANLLFEIGTALRRLLAFVELQPANVRFSLANKYFLLFVGLVAAFVTSRPVFPLIYPPAILSRMTHAFIFGTALTGMLLIMLAMLAVEVFVSPRWWCRTMCPGGALYALLGWARFLRVKPKAGRCTGCGKCAPVCHAGIDPVTQASGIECTNCGECIRVCRTKALAFGFNLPGSNSRSGDSRTAHVACAVLAAGLSLIAFMPVPAYAHHILGLPHYEYKENYPQTPTLEYPATVGPYDILCTCFPGRPIPGEAASFSFYIKNRDTGSPLTDPITIGVVQQRNFGRRTTVMEPTVCELIEQPYKLSATLPRDGEYTVALTFTVEGRKETIPFIISAGNPGSATPVLIAVGVLLLLFIVSLRAVKIKRARKGVPVNREAS